MKSFSTLFALSLTITMFIISGCANGTTTDSDLTNQKNKVGTKDDHDHEEHAHPTEGPHHGALIELGNEEYHAEFIHDDDSGKITIFVLDSEAKQQVPIDASEVVINIKHDGKPEQFKLNASPDKDDPQGKSSRFVSNDKELAQHLDEEGAEPRLVLTINGKSFRGTISHDHDGHDH